MEERTIAIYLDFENLALSAETVYPSKEKPLAMGPLVDFASAKGLICVKKAYADWSREIFSQYQNRLMEQGFELVHLPSATYQGKNGCDVRLTVDVMEYLQLHPGIHRVLIGSGDTDFIPLIQRLRARGKEVIILGFEHSVGALVKRNCNEFKSLEELLGGAEAGAPSGDLSPERLPGQGRQLLLRFIRSREEEEPLLLSTLKQHLLRLDPAFSERELGFASFKDFLRSLEGDVVERFDQEQSALPLVYLRDQPEAPAEAGSPHEQARAFLARKLRYLPEPGRRLQMAEALAEGLRSAGSLAMTQMAEYIYEHCEPKPSRLDIKKYVNTLYTGNAFRPHEKKSFGPLLSRPFRLDETLQTAEALDLVYIRRVGEILESRYPALDASEILELLM